MKTRFLILSTLLLGLVLIQSCSNDSSKEVTEDPVSEEDSFEGIPYDELSRHEELWDEVCTPLEVDELEAFSFEEDIARMQIVKYSFERPPGGTPIIEGGEMVGKLGFDYFSEIVELDRTEIDSLKMILQSYQNETSLISMADCYFPRHCIHFFDENDDVIAYLELCLECWSYRTNRSELKLNCDAQLIELGRFIDRHGLPRK